MYTSERSQPMINTDLCKIMKAEGADKCSDWHNYTQYYHSIFTGIRDNPIHILELGLGSNNIQVPSNMGPNYKSGSSLRGWRNYFPNAQVYGCDIDRATLFESERIKTYYCDQRDRNVISKMYQDIGINLDIIIDDGLHDFGATKLFFEESFNILRSDGQYIIEDVICHHIPHWAAYLSSKGVNYEIVQIHNLKNKIDNNIIRIIKS